MEVNMSVEVEKRFIVDQGGLPELYPTHLHEAKFWEALGRTVATFGFLEETLGKAIFSFTATKPYREDEIQKEVFDTAVDIDFLNQVQRYSVDLVRAVVDSVTHMGWQFPGSSSPGRAIWHDG